MIWKDGQLSNQHRRPLNAMVGGPLAVFCALVACMGIAQPAFAATDVTVVTKPSAAVSAEAGVKVDIVDFAFFPAEITIAPGEGVTWINDDGAPHAIAYDDGAKGTDLLLPGASFSRRFDRPGTYDYHCAVHPYMMGRVVVRAK